MRDYGYFWNSRGGDRKYNAEDMADWIAPFFTTGVFGGGLFVKEKTNMTVEVEAGYCNFDGKVKNFEMSTLFTLNVASLSANRVDTIVVEKNNSDRSITMKAITGTEGAGPTPPVRTGDIYQIVLAQINVAASTNVITQADITDTRSDSYLCGTVTPTAFDEFAEEFNSWFEHFKSNISGDAAGQLSNRIDLLDAGKQNNDTWVQVILSHSNWVQQQNGTYVYSLENLYSSDDYDILDVLPVADTTASMRNAWISADCGGFEVSNVIRCHGVPPSIDIVIGLNIRAKGGILP